MIISMLGSTIASALLVSIPVFLLSVGVRGLFNLDWDLYDVAALWSLATAVHMLLTQFFMIKKAAS